MVFLFFILCSVLLEGLAPSSSIEDSSLESFVEYFGESIVSQEQDLEEMCLEYFSQSQILGNAYPSSLDEKSFCDYYRYSDWQESSSKTTRLNYLRQGLLYNDFIIPAILNGSSDIQERILIDLSDQPILFILVMDILVLSPERCSYWVQKISERPVMKRILYDYLFVFPLQFPEKYKQFCIIDLNVKSLRERLSMDLFWEYFQRDILSFHGAMTMKALKKFGILQVPFEKIYSFVCHHQGEVQDFVKQLELYFGQCKTEDIPEYSLQRSGHMERPKLEDLFKMYSQYPCFVKAVIKSMFSFEELYGDLLYSGSDNFLFVIWMEVTEDQYFDEINFARVWARCRSLLLEDQKKVYSRLHSLSVQGKLCLCDKSITSENLEGYCARRDDFLKLESVAPELAHSIVVKYAQENLGFCTFSPEYAKQQIKFYMVFPECISLMDMGLLLNAAQLYPEDFEQLLRIMRKNNVYPRMEAGFLLKYRKEVTEWVTYFPQYGDVVLQMFYYDSEFDSSFKDIFSHSISLGDSRDIVGWLSLFLIQNKGLKIFTLMLLKNRPKEEYDLLLGFCTNIEKLAPLKALGLELEKQLQILTKCSNDEDLFCDDLMGDYQEDIQHFIQRKIQQDFQGKSLRSLKSDQDCFLAKVVVHAVTHFWNLWDPFFMDSNNVFYVINLLMENRHFETVQMIWGKLPSSSRVLDLGYMITLRSDHQVLHCLKSLSKMDQKGLIFQIWTPWRYWIFPSTILNFLKSLEDEDGTVCVRSILTSEGNSLLLDFLIRVNLTRLSSLRDCVLYLCQKGIDVNRHSPQGTPLIYLLYNWHGLAHHPTSEEILTLLVESYGGFSRSQEFKLSPDLAQGIHSEMELQEVVEHAVSPIGCVLRRYSYSQKKYNSLKEHFPLDYKNHFERNILHHLAKISFEMEPDICGALHELTPEKISTLVNQPDIDGMTPLMYAVDNPYFFKQLLKMKPDVTRIDTRGLSVFHHLLIRGKKECIQEFLEYYSTICNDCDDCKNIQDTSWESLHRILYFQARKYYPFRIPFWEYLQMMMDEPVIAMNNHRGSDFLLPIEDTLLYTKIVFWRSLEEQSSEMVRESPEFYRALMDPKTTQLVDNVGKIQRGYSITNPFEVCSYYGLYVPSMRNHMLRHSFLCDGFRMTFEKAFDLMIQDSSQEPSFDHLIQKHRMSLMLAREYLWAWSVAILAQYGSLNSSGLRIEQASLKVQFAYRLWMFFQSQKDSFCEPIQHVMSGIQISEEGLLTWDYPKIAQMIHEEEQGVLFSFVHYLPENIAWQLESELRTHYPFPEYEGAFNVKRTIRMELIKTILDTFAEGEVDRVQKYHEEIEKVHQRLEDNAADIDSLEQIVQGVFGLSDVEISLDTLRFNGRTASFIHQGKEYLVKVVEQGEKMRDAAIIKYLQENDPNFSNGQRFDQYGTVRLGNLSQAFAEQLYERLCCQINNSRMKRKSQDLDLKVHLIEVTHPDYFKYVSDPSVSFDQLEQGVSCAMEQAFYLAEKYGLWMTAFCDLAHSVDRPAMFCSLAEGNDCFFGSRLGFFYNIFQSMYPCDISTWGLRDIGNMYHPDLEPFYEFLSNNLKDHVSGYEEYMKSLGKEDELKRQSIIKAIQHSGMMFFLIPTFFLYNYLFHHPKERLDFDIDRWVSFIEKTTFEPFRKSFLVKGTCEPFKSWESFEAFQLTYMSWIKEDLKAFQENPKIITEVIIHQVQQGVIRDCGFQSPYAIGLLFWTQVRRRNFNVLCDQSHCVSA